MGAAVETELDMTAFGRVSKARHIHIQTGAG